MANSYGMMVPAILATLRKRESGTPQGNYTIRNPNMSASGAYQFIDPTWRTLTRKYGVGTEYPRAYLAPPSVQDEVAKRQVMGLLSQGYGPEAIAKTWYTGNPQGRMSAAAIAANNGLTADKYAANWMRDFAKLSGSGYASQPPMDTSHAAMAPQGFVPTPPVRPSDFGPPMDVNPMIASDAPNAGIGGDMAGGMGQGQGMPDYMSQIGKFAGMMGGGGGGGDAPMQRANIEHFSMVGRPNADLQLAQAQPVQMTPFGRGKRRGLLGQMGA